MAVTAPDRNLTPYQSFRVPGRGWCLDGWNPGDAEAVMGAERPERADVVLRDVPCGRVVRPLSGQVRQVPDPKGSDGVEGEALPQVVVVVEAAVLDPSAQLVPAQRLAGGVGTGPAETPELWVARPVISRARVDLQGHASARNDRRSAGSHVLGGIGAEGRPWLAYFTNPA